MTFGQLRTDATVYNTAAPSMRMTPNTRLTSWSPRHWVVAFRPPSIAAMP